MSDQVGTNTVTANNYTTWPLPGPGDGWVVPRLESSVVTKTTSTGETAVRTVSFDYDPITGLLNKEVIAPGNLI